MIEIRLQRGMWMYDPAAALGKPGGFGAVFLGSGSKHKKVAVKRLHINASQAAHRELHIADVLANRDLEYVMPVYDAGQDAESNNYYIVMPCAEMNLRDAIRKRGVFNELETVNILKQIALGLLEVSDLVHRDLKPENVLYHEHRWKIADFGISRFVEDSTSIQTLKDCWTPQYAAPEQWRLERATSATDVYALGCIAYDLIAGYPPFVGDVEDLNEQHCSAEPPRLDSIQPQLRGLISSMLRKPQQSRPSISRVLNILEQLSIKDLSSPNTGTGFQLLAEAGADETIASTRLEMNQMEISKVRRERDNIATVAFSILESLIDLFDKKCQFEVPELKRYDKTRGNLPPIPGEMFHAGLGSATMEIMRLGAGSFQSISQRAFSMSGWDVVAGATICVTQNRPQFYKWGANLWYTNLGDGSEFRWWEVPYYNLFSPPDGKVIYEPHFVTNIKEADLAASNSVYQIGIARKPICIDDENAEEFCDRWAEILARAYYGKLSCPPRFPMS